MNTIDLCVEIMRKEYGLFNPPLLGTRRFSSLIFGSRQIINDTLDLFSSEKRASRLYIGSETDEAAFTNAEMDISIPSWYCSQEAIEEFVEEDVTRSEATAISIMMINGSSVHEALHVALSQTLFSEDAQKYIVSKANSRLYKEIVNIVEDLKNEETLRLQSELLFSFVSVKNEVFFPFKRMKKIFEDVKEKGKEEVAIETRIKRAVFQILVFYKNLSRREAIDNLLIKAEFKTVIDALHAAVSPAANTFEVSDKLYNFFFESQKGAEGDGKNGLSEMDNLFQKMQGIANSDMEAKRVIGTMVILDGDKWISRYVEATKIEPIQVVDILDSSYPHRDGYSIPKIKTDFSFIKHIKVARQIVQSLDEPRVRGNLLVNTRLSRIATDGKIFTKRGKSFASIDKSHPTFVILIDASSSMGSLFGVVLETVKKMSDAMVEAGIAHSVLAHTSVNKPAHDSPVMYVIYEFKNGKGTSESREQRFAEARKITLDQNLDGYAIEAANLRFGKATNKILLSLSDGNPCSSNYHDGDNHTKDVIHRVRNTGTKVISLSLKSEVIDANNEIYGAKNNIDCTSQKSLESNLKRLILS